MSIETNDLVTWEELAAFETDGKIAAFVNQRHRAVMRELFKERGRLRDELSRALDISPGTVAVVKLPVPAKRLVSLVVEMNAIHGAGLRLCEHPEGWLCFFHPTK